MTKHFTDAMDSSKYRCIYCGKDLLVDFETFMSAEEDHLIPISKGGLDEKPNIVMACHLCNLLKANWYPEGGKKMSRKEYIDAAREHILSSRMKHMRLYFGWIFHEDTDLGG
jgi:5-methylcytosine-specific restriction endonuclease McrA